MQSIEVQTNLAQLRTKRAISAANLAAEAGISRQTIHAIESGLYVPNTSVSLKLARILGTTVEELFQLEPEQEVIEETAEVFILGEVPSLQKGQPLRVVSVNDRLVAVPPDPASWGLQPTDAVFLAPIRGGISGVNAKVRLLGNAWKNPARILLAGCDPSASLLAHALERQGFELIIAYENSSQALALLHEGLVHVAGTHLAEKASNKADLLPISKMFPRGSIAILSYAKWKEGLIVPQDNPKKVAGIEDLSRKDIRITNREPGAGCRRLLDDLLRNNQIANEKVRGYDRITPGQLPAARLVQSGEVDCCIGTQAAAASMGLTFLPLAEKPYLLVLRRSHLTLPPVQALFETLGRTAYRREVEACVGYDMRTAGDRLV
ncbi:MAG: substrate-binding domain-containing protein [Terracidiphilus sp.]|jgi:molybdate-binding protein/DNA-binding XRE family transcriptional regulator